MTAGLANSLSSNGVIALSSEVGSSNSILILLGLLCNLLEVPRFRKIPGEWPLATWIHEIEFV